jgi:hypothetical protein
VPCARVRTRIPESSSFIMHSPAIPTVP